MQTAIKLVQPSGDLGQQSRIKQLERPCPVCCCGSGEVLLHQNFAVFEGYPLPDQYDVVLCGQCGMLFADTPATQAAYEDYYAHWSSYEQPAGAAAGATSAEDRIRHERTGALFAEHIPFREARILDVGCANGGLLQVLAQHGFDHLAGVDPSPVCAQNTRRNGFEGYCGDLAHLPAEMGRFDVVILQAVLEHLVDVRAAIEALSKVCTENGRIFLEVPDASRYADSLHAPLQDINTEHINHFSLASLENLMVQFQFYPLFARQENCPGPSGLIFAPLEAGFARRAGHGPQAWRIDPRFRGQIERYFRDSRAMFEAIDRQLQTILAADPEILVWGTGQLAMKLLCATVLREARIAAFVDENPIKAGKRLRGVPVISPAQVTGDSRPILLTTLLHTVGIRARIASLGLSNPVFALLESGGWGVA